jgi:hypothetical protein
MKASGRMIRVKATESIFTLTELSIRANGLKTNKRDMGWKHGQTEPSMKEDTKMG